MTQIGPIRTLSLLTAFLFLAPDLRAQLPISFMLYDPAPEVEGRFGVDVQIADLDGDGVGEVIVGAEGKTVNGAVQAGMAYIRTGVLTPNPAWVVVTEPTINGTGGPRVRDRFGFRILVADLNLDGYQDMVVSARGVKVDKDCEQGEVFVLYGPWTLVPSPTTPPYAGGAIGIVEDPVHRNNPAGDTYGDKFGFSIALGDPNQDGYPDLVIGSPYSLIGDHVNQNGEAYIYWGPSFTASLELELPWDDPPYPPVNYPYIEDRLWGRDVACGNVADWERSSNDDIIVAAYNADNPPGVGGNHGWIRVFRDYMGTSYLDRVVDIRRPGGDVDQVNFGYAIHLGKYYGSAYLDMMVGAPYEGYQMNKGEVHVFQGGPGFPGNAFMFNRAGGTQRMDKFGVDVDFLGDQDGDGLSELAVGAIWFNAASTSEYSQDFGPGRVFIPKSATGTFSYIDDPHPEVFRDNYWYGFGAALAVGKIDANAKLDLAIGNARTTDPATQTEKAGEVRVVVYH